MTDAEFLVFVFVLVLALLALGGSMGRGGGFISKPPTNTPRPDVKVPSQVGGKSDGRA